MVKGVEWFESQSAVKTAWECRWGERFGLEFTLWGLMDPFCPDPDPTAIDSRSMCYTLSHMKTTTVRELRNNYSQVLKWVAKGE